MAYSTKGINRQAIGSVPRSSVETGVPTGDQLCLPDLVGRGGGDQLGHGVGIGEVQRMRSARGRHGETELPCGLSVIGTTAIAVHAGSDLAPATTIGFGSHGLNRLRLRSSPTWPEPQPERAAQVLVGRAQGVGRCCRFSRLQIPVKSENGLRAASIKRPDGFSSRAGWLFELLEHQAATQSGPAHRPWRARELEASTGRFRQSHGFAPAATKGPAGPRAGATAAKASKFAFHVATRQP